MHFLIEKGTKITFGAHKGVIENHFVETGKLTINLENGKVITKSVDQLIKKYNKGEVSFGDLPTRVDPKTRREKEVYIDMTLTEAQRKTIKRKKGYIESCLINGRLRDVQGCDLHVRAHALYANDSVCPTARTVRKWAYRYLATNCDPRSLLECNDRRGNRKPKLPETVRTLIATTVKSECLRRNGSSIKQASEVINAELRKRSEHYGVSRVSYKTVRAVVAALPVGHKVSKRQGYKKYRNEFPSGFHGEKPVNLLERVEIDQTQLNLYCVDPVTQQVIGRPWLTMGIDVTSGMIVWFHLSMKRLDGSMLPRILYMAMRPKDMAALRTQYPELKSDWPLYGIFQTVVLDNSMENHTQDFQDACTDVLGIQVHYVPPAQGSLKPYIERMFGYVKTSFTTLFEGSYTKDDEEKYAYRHAVLTMEELVKHFSIWIIDKYHNTYHERLGMTPFEKWNECIEAHGNTRLPGNVRDFDRLLYRSKTATLQKDGLQLETLTFKSPALMSLARKIGFKVKLGFYFNSYDLSKIFVKVPGSDDFIEAECSNKDYRLNTVTMEEHKEVRRLINDNKKLRDKNPDAAITAAFEALRGAALDTRKRANAKVRKAKASKRAPTSDQLMNGSTKKTAKAKQVSLQDFAPWLAASNK